MRLESLPGLILDQKYRIERRLGEGSMGAVFQATHLGTMRPVALKVLVPQLAGSEEFGQRFKREAEAAGRLSHPNVVDVTDFGITQAGGQELAYLVMEYLEGESLADYLKKTPKAGIDLLLDIMEQTGLALDASHAAGIVHRDLKPSNIWLEPNHRGGYNVKVLDFGIAKVVNSAEKTARAAADAVATVVMPAPGASLPLLHFGESPLATPSNVQTIAGSILGTPAYMAPEQCTHLEVTGLADVYSMAVIAYEMLCGRAPFEAPTLGELIRLQIQTTAPSPREWDATVPPAMAEVVLSGLEKDPARRPHSAGAFAARLRTASDGELSLLRRSKDIFHGHPRQFMLAMLACLSVIALFIPLRLAAARAVDSGWPLGPISVALMLAGAMLTFFGHQLFKACGALIVKYASEHGQFHGATRAALRHLIAEFGGVLRTELASLADLRPSSFWANTLWPVVWALEGRSGKDAVVRSRQLCEPLRTASLSLVIRQYTMALLGFLIFPGIMALTDPTGGAVRFLMKEVLAGSAFGWFIFLYPLMFGFMFLNYCPAFSLLYWSALRWRNEGSEIDLPAPARDLSRKSAAKAFRPATLIWIALPLVFILIIIVRLGSSGPSRALADASGDDRRADVLKLIDGGIRVDQPTGDGETALFDAVRNGDDELVTLLLKRGANVNVTSLDKKTPLLIAARSGRNDLARILLDHGAQVNASDRDGRTALMIAAMRGNRDLAQLLLERGASAAKTDSFGKTAAAYAREEGYDDLAGLLSPVR